MTITHDVKYKREDGTEVEIVPLKDIVVTAPGYSTYGYNNDWRVELDNDAHQSTQLYEAAMKKMPKETDTWECLFMHQSSDGGNAKYRAYLERAKVPVLRERIRSEMIRGTPRQILFKDEMVAEGPAYDPSSSYINALSPETEEFLDFVGLFIGFGLDDSYEKNAMFYMPELSKKIGEMKYGRGLPLGFSIEYRESTSENWRWLPKSPGTFKPSKNKGKLFIIHGCSLLNKDSLENRIHELERSDEGLVDKLRAEILREIIGDKNAK